MIQVYSEGNINYTKNGDIVLTPTEAYTECELNGSWSAYISHPIDPEGRWKYLTEQAVVKMPSWNGEQLYRIANRTKTDTEVMCTMNPIFYDSMNDCFLVDVRPTNKTGQQALNLMLAPNSKYTGVSNISKHSTAYYEYKNFMEALNGEENSFLERWGGEIEFDNYTVKVNAHLGEDNGLELRYGKNIQYISEDIDMTQVTTRIYPKAYNGRKKTGTPYVDSPLKNSYPVIKTATLTFDNIKYKDDATDDDRANPDIIICRTQSALNSALATACQTQYDAGLDKPIVNITIEGVFELSKIPEYSQFSQPVGLGDTVHLIHSRLGIKTDARIIYLRYDSIREQTADVQIGQTSYDFFRASYASINKIDAVVRADNTLRAEKVSGQIDMKQANLYAQYDVSARTDVIGILFENNDSTSELYGAMAIGTQGFMIADHKDGDGNWVFNTLGTARGLVADYIVSGVLKSMTGSSFWDLNDSKFVFSDELFDSKVILDEGYIQFIHGVQEFAKILRATLDGGQTDILQILAEGGISFSVGNIRILIKSSGTSGDGIWITGDDIHLTSDDLYIASDDENETNIHIGNGNGTRTGYTGNFTAGTKTVYVHAGLITQVS